MNFPVLFSKDLLSDTVATGLMWLFKFKLINKILNQFLSHTSHILSAQQPHMASDYHIR